MSACGASLWTFPRFEWDAIRAYSGTHFPALVARMHWCHAAPVRVHLLSREYEEIECGVEQGDPLGCLLVSVVIFDEAEAARADLSNVGIVFFNIWYL